MKKIIPILFILLLFSCVPQKNALTTGYYVSPVGNDSNSGNQTAPFKTIQKAANVAQAGSVVYVAPGTYAPFVTKFSGIAGAPITFVGSGAVIDGKNGSDNGIYIPNSFITIIGFEVMNNGNPTTGRKGVYVAGTGAHDIVLQDLIVHDNYQEGIMVYNGAYNYVIQNVKSYHNGQVVGGAGIIVYQAGANGKILNNELYNNGDWAKAGVTYASGIEVCWTATNILIDGNRIYHNAMQGIDLCGDSSGTTVSNNIVYGNGNVGIGPNNGTFNNVIKNNVVYGNKQSAGWGGGIYVWGTVSGTQILNNTIYGEQRNGIGIESTKITGTTIKNNISWGNTTDLLVNSVVVEDYNDLRGGKGSHDIALNPLFVNVATGDFHLQPGSPVIGKGESGIDLGALPFQQSIPITPTQTRTSTPTLTRTPTVTPVFCVTATPVITPLPVCVP